MAILTTTGRIAFQSAMSVRSMHLAWGTGDVSWGGSPPAESTESVALVAEVGRRAPLQIAFVEPDAEGAVELPGGEKYSIVEEATRYLMLDFHFAFLDAATDTIREIGIFVDTVTAEGISPSKPYLLPEEVEDPGILLVTENLDLPIVRSEAVRERFTYILSL
jgi:hypothetical protein